MTAAGVPRQLLTRTKAMGIKNMKATTHVINPQNANSSTTFGYNSTNKVSFLVPAYAGWLNPARSYLSYTVKTETGYFMAPGCPVINRLVIRNGAGGQILEDIQQYSVIQRLLNNYDGASHIQAKAATSGDHRVAQMIGGGVTGAQLKNLYENGTTVKQELVSGLLGRGQDFFIPTYLFNGTGSACLEIEMYLEDPVNAVLSDADTTRDANDNGDYSLTNVQLSLEVITMPKEISDKFDKELYSGSSVRIPYSQYRLHQNYVAQNSKLVDLMIAESSHDLESIWTCFRPQALQHVSWDGASGDTSEALDNFSTVGGHVDNTKSKSDPDSLTFDTVKAWHVRYGDRMFPARRCENADRDNKATLLNNLHTLDKAQDECFVGAMNKNLKSIFDSAGTFAIIQSFKTTRDPQLLNSLNSSTNGIPLEMTVEFAKPASQALRVEHFVKSNHVVEINRGGNINLYNGGVSKEV